MVSKSDEKPMDALEYKHVKADRNIENNVMAREWIKLRVPSKTQELAYLQYSLVNEIRYLPEKREDFARLLVERFGKRHDIVLSDKVGFSLIYNKKLVSNNSLIKAIGRIKIQIKKQRTERRRNLSKK